MCHEKFKVAYIYSYLPIVGAEKSELDEIDAELIMAECKNENETISAGKDADALMVQHAKITKKVITSLSKCKIIARLGVGYDNVDVKAATEHGIMVANVPDYCIEEVSDHAVASLLDLARKLTLSDRRVRKGDWDIGYLKPLRRIKGLTVGIIGMGRIGRLSASKLNPFGVKLIFFDPFLEGDIIGDSFNAEKVTLQELVAVSDAILIHASANADTYHLFNKELFSQMKKKPVIINCARGSLIETDALVEALSNGLVSGAALDVIEEEPFLPNNPLCQFENVIITPHSAWYSEDANKLLQLEATRAVVSVLMGGQPKSLVNPEVLDVINNKEN
jgi:D-3-phosphoglycerate dehydrogenase